MKNIITTIALSVIMIVSANANTNQVENLLGTLPLTNAPDSSDVTKHDITINAGGIIVPKTGTSETGISVSFSENPFSFAREIWVGVSQSVGWEPFAGSTDIDINWCFHVYKQLYTLPGVSVGAAYDNESSPIFRASPELQLQYYFTDDCYLIGQGNYDVYVSRGDKPFRWSLGIGWEF